ncbi:hypothetical protein Salat_1084800 [Sesamum alatum]|uniref:Uncharacterized protein n=1 Tax=Sesamum alatum TaxID=300844 RepID=A0AAE1YN09_9LAMI|nr:hypothetical protein Salat_1084800 [Sesamum alatum]
MARERQKAKLFDFRSEIAGTSKLQSAPALIRRALSASAIGSRSPPCHHNPHDGAPRSSQKSGIMMRDKFGGDPLDLLGFPYMLLHCDLVLENYPWPRGLLYDDLVFAD